MTQLLRERLEECLTALFFLTLVLLALVREAPILEPLHFSRLAEKTIFGVLLVSLAIVALRPRAESLANLKGCLREFLPLIVALLGYESLKHMHATALTLWLGIQPKDALMMSIDQFLFGQTPYLWFAAWGLDQPDFIAVMAFFYSLYYFLPIALLGWLMLQGDLAGFRLVRRALIVALYGGYCFYVLIPVAGPLSSPTPLNPLFFETLLGFQFLMNIFRYSYDCFPSLHTAIPWLLVIVSHNRLPRWLHAVLIASAIGITTSTVALRFHYGIDVLAGLLWAVLVSAITRRSMPQHLHANSRQAQCLAA